MQETFAFHMPHIPPFPAQSLLHSSQPRWLEILPMPARALDSNASESPIEHRLSPLSVPSLPSSRMPQSIPVVGQVVGSQGRRGVLPSAHGRPTIEVGGTTTGQRASSVPQKDANGKFPCPHCPKTYLHAKHLKRHLLRRKSHGRQVGWTSLIFSLDTDTRPYSCGLCRETFSRSDILKRHFQKCSVRRGNPTGENHLDHSRAIKKSNLEAAGKLLREKTSRTRSVPSCPTPAIRDFAPTNIPTFDFHALPPHPLYQPFPEGEPYAFRASCAFTAQPLTTSGLGEIPNGYGY